MKVIDLRCQSGHRFEGWFASDEDFLDQNGRGQIECPLCADRLIVRLPSAPRLNLSASSSGPAREPAASDGAAELQARWMQMVRHVLEHTEDVGAKFAHEARRIHYGEAPQRGIRGQASADEREALHDEGIEVVPLPIPAALKDTLQ
jgi:hypothetical protein